MKILIGGGALLLVMALVFTSGIFHPSDWPGVDEAVVKKFAEKGGRPARDPIINTVKGDLALFVFLLAGTLGGFTAGYYYRELFPQRTRDSAPEINA